MKKKEWKKNEINDYSLSSFQCIRGCIILRVNCAFRWSIFFFFSIQCQYVASLLFVRFRKYSVFNFFLIFSGEILIKSMIAKWGKRWRIADIYFTFFVVWFICFATFNSDANSFHEIIVNKNIWIWIFFVILFTLLFLWNEVQPFLTRLYNDTKCKMA